MQIYSSSESFPQDEPGRTDEAQENPHKLLDWNQTFDKYCDIRTKYFEKSVASTKCRFATDLELIFESCRQTVSLTKEAEEKLIDMREECRKRTIELIDTMDPLPILKAQFSMKEIQNYFTDTYSILLSKTREFFETYFSNHQFLYGEEGGVSKNSEPVSGKDKIQGPSISKRKLPRQAVEILRQWKSDHGDNHHPSKEEKELLAYKARVSVKQVNTWFVNNRVRPRNRVRKMNQPGVKKPAVVPGLLSQIQALRGSTSGQDQNRNQASQF